MSPFPRGFIAAAAALGLVAVSSAQTTYFVDAASPTPGAGTSWGTAFQTLAAAFAVAAPGDSIWVTALTYTPTPGTLRTDTFAIPPGVSLYGGFFGFETAITQRVPGVKTRLSGEIGSPGSFDNCYHVVTISDPCSLDAFDIFFGNANGAAPFDAGGGVHISPSSVLVSGVHLNDVRIRNNEATRGAGLYATDAKFDMLRCSVHENTATSSGEIGRAHV